VSGPDRTAVRADATPACPGFITALLLRCGHGDEAALGLLFDLFYAPVAATVGGQARPEMVETLVHAAFVRVWCYAPTFVPGDQRPVEWVMEQALATAQSVIVTSPAVTTAG
jgi:hypothetical protein